MNHGDSECVCFNCYMRKRLEHYNGSAVEIAGNKVVTYIDSAIVIAPDGTQKAMLGFEPNVKISDMLLIIGALVKAANDMIRDEVRLDDNAEKH